MKSLKLSRWATVGILCTLFMIITACHESSSNNGAPTSSGVVSNTPPADKLPTNGAPQVMNPVDTDKLEQAPCSILTYKQLEDLGISVAGMAGRPPGGPQCVWPDKDGVSGFEVSATFSKFSSGQDGLSRVYRNRSNFEDFEPLPSVNGFPAVIANDAKKTRAYGACNIELGLSDKQALSVSVFVDQANPNYHNSCGVAQEAARGFTSTIRTLAGS